MVATLVLEASAERRESSSLSSRTSQSRSGGIGSHSRLKICRLRAYGFESRFRYHIRGLMPCYTCSNGKRGRYQFDTLKACKDAEAAIHAKKSCETYLKKDTEECCLNADKIHVTNLSTLQGAESPA